MVRGLGLPDSEGGLQQCGNAHCSEDGSDQEAHSVLVAANTHGFRQQERNRDGATETCQVVLQ